MEPIWCHNCGSGDMAWDAARQAAAAGVAAVILQEHMLLGRSAASFVRYCNTLGYRAFVQDAAPKAGEKGSRGGTATLVSKRLRSATLHAWSEKHCYFQLVTAGSLHLGNAYIPPSADRAWHGARGPGARARGSGPGARAWGFKFFAEQTQGQP